VGQVVGRLPHDRHLCASVSLWFYFLVMPGLDPGIHVGPPNAMWNRSFRGIRVDRRVKPGDDEIGGAEWMARISFCPWIVSINQRGIGASPQTGLGGSPIK